VATTVLLASRPAHVGHGGGYHRVVGQPACLFQLARQQKQDGVAVNHVAFRIGKQGAVSVAVKADAKAGFAGHNLAAHDFGVQSTTALIDIAAVGRAVSELGVQAATSEDLGGDEARCSVGAIDHRSQAVHSVERPRQPVDVRRTQLRVSGKRRKVRCMCGCRRRRLQQSEYLGLNFQLRRVGQPVAVAAENLDAVVLPGIV